MVSEITKWEDLDLGLIQAFSPATAINRRDLFQGRRDVLRRLTDVVFQAGQHAIIFGERGVGKTSAANVLSDCLRPITSETIVSARFNCHGQITYREIWESLFREVGLPIKDEYARFGVSDVVDTLRQSDDKMVIFIIDEFDRIGDPDIDILFADTVKALSDFDIDTTLIMVGVADDVDDLITEHASIERCLVQVRVPRMPSEELAQIVRHGISAVGMNITEDAVDRICTLSLGLPHYGHALGLASGRAAAYEHSEAVEGRHVYAAVDTLIEESAQSILQQFDSATGSPRRENLYFKVLVGCALAATDDLGCFRAADVREPYSYIMDKIMEIPSFGRHLHGLSADNRGPVLQRLGTSHQYRYRFVSPLMQPYVLMRGMQNGLIDLEDISKFKGREFELVGEKGKAGSGSRQSTSQQPLF